MGCCREGFLRKRFVGELSIREKKSKKIKTNGDLTDILKHLLCPLLGCSAGKRPYVQGYVPVITAEKTAPKNLFALPSSSIRSTSGILPKSRVFRLAKKSKVFLRNR